MHAHVFSRDRAAAHCYVCQGMWPESSAVATKYYSCSSCGVSCHAGCRAMALRCYPCCQGAEHKQLDVSALRALPQRGKICCALLQAYDLAIPNGRSIYGISKLSGSKEVIKTKASVVCDGECAWMSDEQRPSPRSGSPSGGTVSGAGAGERSLEPQADDDSLDWLPSKFNPDGAFSEAARNIIDVELWNSSLYGVFDTLVLDTKISLVPILLHPNVAVERWFSIGSIEGKPSGMMLVRLVFVAEQSFSKVATAILSKQPSNNKQIPSSVFDVSREELVRKEVSASASSHAAASSELGSASSGVRDALTGPAGHRPEEVPPPLSGGGAESQSSRRADTKETVSPNADAIVLTAEKKNSVLSSTQKPFELEPDTTTAEKKVAQAGAADAEETAGLTPGWMRTTLLRSMKQLNENVRTLVWDEYRMPRNKHKRNADKAAVTRADVSIGKLHIKLIDAYRTDVKDAADGDYFATCAVVDLTGTVVHNDELLEEDTHTVFNSAAPAFNCNFEFDVPHFRCGVRFILIDGASGRKIGTSYISIYSLLQVCICMPLCLFLLPNPFSFCLSLIVFCFASAMRSVHTSGRSHTAGYFRSGWPGTIQLNQIPLPLTSKPSSARSLKSLCLKLRWKRREKEMLKPFPFEI
jgi:hypothetical protein